MCGPPIHSGKARSTSSAPCRRLVANAGFPQDLPKTWRDSITFVADYEAFRNVDFVIETVVEDVEIKNQVFDQLERVVGDDVPIASNTSSLSVSLLAERRRHPERFLGMHWAEPAYATRFIELIRGEHTNDRNIRAGD